MSYALATTLAAYCGIYTGVQFGLFIRCIKSNSFDTITVHFCKALLAIAIFLRFPMPGKEGFTLPFIITMSLYPILLFSNPPDEEENDESSEEKDS